MATPPTLTMNALQHLHGAMSSLEQLLESEQYQDQGEEQPKHEHRQVKIFPQLTALFPRLLTGGHIGERDVHQVSHGNWLVRVLYTA